MNSRVYSLAAVIIEAVALICYFMAVTEADRALPKGNGGDLAAFELWNDRAGFAFWILFGVWAVVFGAVLIGAARSRSFAVLLKSWPYSSPLTWALALPVGGIVLGYFGLTVL